MEIPAGGIDQGSEFEDFLKKFNDLAKVYPAVWAVLRNLQKVRWLRGRIPNAGGKLGTAASAVSAAAAIAEYLIETGATPAALHEALKPYTSRADLFGLKISDMNPPSTFNTVLIPIIYADDLTPNTILQRFAKFLEASDSLKRLGLRAKFVGNQASIYPLLIYFDSKRLEQDKELLWPQIFEEKGTEGLKPRTRSDKASRTPGFKATLSAGVVDVQERWVLSDIFDADDLHSVLKWGTERE